MRISQLDIEHYSHSLLDFSQKVPVNFISFVNKYFFRAFSDSGENGDCILVLGSRNGLKYRVPTAISLFKSGRAPFIMASGGSPTDFGLCEAELYKKTFLSENISNMNILTECESTNTYENMVFSSRLLTDKFSKNLKIIIVTNAFHMRRAILTAAECFPKNFQLIPCPVIDTNTRADNWFLTEKGRMRIDGELRSLVFSVRKGWLEDDNIEL